MGPSPLTEIKHDGYGTYFFPTLQIGEKAPQSVPTNRLFLYSTYDPYTYKAFDSSYNDIPLIINKDGLIAVFTLDKRLAIVILNTIMAVSILQNLGLFAIREHELFPVRFDKAKKVIYGANLNVLKGNTVRGKKVEPLYIREGSITKLVVSNPKPVFKPQVVAIEVMKQIIQKAAKVHEGKNQELLLLAEAYTHLNNGEFSQSFTMSWNIIERYVSEIWIRTLAKKQIRGERKSKLLNSIFWSTDYLLEVLNVSGNLGETEYVTFMEIKSKRNGFIHGQKEITEVDAQRCFNIGKSIVTKKLPLKH
jgi:hypothetical protein